MVEIRHALTGRLAQVITGSQITLTYDGVSLSSSSAAVPPSPLVGHSSGRPYAPQQSSHFGGPPNAFYQNGHDRRRASDESSSFSAHGAGQAGDADRVLHFSMRVGSFHVLYEMSPVALSTSTSTSTGGMTNASRSTTMHTSSTSATSVSSSTATNGGPAGLGSSNSSATMVYSPSLRR